jgi:hypothetical protein
MPLRFCRPWWFILKLTLALPLGCGSPERTIPEPPAPAPAPPAPRDAIADTIAEIPARCLAPPSFVPMKCSVSSPEPDGACVVELRDRGADRLTDRFVFDSGRLLRHESTLSDVQRSIRTLAYDDRGRLARENSCLTATGAPSTWHPPWRAPMVRYESPTTIVTRTDRHYAPGSDVPVFGLVQWSTEFEGKIVHQEMKLCYRFDLRGRRAARYQVYRMNDRPRALDTEVRRYRYREGRLEGITFSTLNLDRREGAPGWTVRWKNVWRAIFSHDVHGRQIKVEAGGSTTQYEYGAHGHLTRFNSLALTWDAADRLVSLQMGSPDFDRQYLYDAAGRFVGARHTNGAGYRVVYSEGCQAAFSHPQFAPNADHYLHYEGKDTL